MIAAAVKKRTSLTPSTGTPAVDGVHAMRRGGARREVTERIALRGQKEGAPNLALNLEGWALNVSRGGVRAILEEKVELGSEFEITIGEGGKSPLTRQGRVVWVQEEQDGVIVGIEFISLSGTHRSAPPVPPDQKPA
jgi:hypothetical protein